MFKYLTAFILLFSMTTISALELDKMSEEVFTTSKSIIFSLKEDSFSSEQIGSYTHQKLLLCDNGLDGSFEYKSASEIALYPEMDLAASKKYTCTVNEELFKGSSSSLSFNTEDFRVNESLFFPEGNIRLSFNDKVDKEALQKALFIKKEKNLAQTNLSYTLEVSDDAKTFLIQINEDISNANILVNIDKSLLSLNGIPLKVDYTNSFKEDIVVYYRDHYRQSMTIYDAPRAVSLPDGRLGIRMYFEGSFYGDSVVKKFIRIKGMKSFNLSSRQYVGSTERRVFGLSNRSYYYIDVTGDFESAKSYEITLKEGLKDSYRYQLREDKKYTVLMKDRNPALKFESDKPYLSSLGEIGFESTNVTSINLVVEKLLDQNYRYFVNFDNGAPSSLGRLGKEVLSKKFTLGGQKNIFTKHKISLKPFIGDFDSGVYRMVIHYNGSNTKSKAVYFSDLGILSKVSNDQVFVSISRLSNTKKIAGAEILLYSAKNELIASGKSNKEGIWVYEKKNLSELRPRSVVVNYKKEQNFLVLNSALNSVYMPYKERVYNKYKAMIYFQSKLIRPGEDLSALIVLKDKNFASAPTMPFKISIKDPSYREIYTKEAIANEAGAFNLVLPMLEEYKTGKYTLDVKFANRSIGSKHFSVEAFLPQKIKNEITFKKEAYGVGQVIKAELSSKYLFGTPSSGLKAEVRMNALAKNYKNKDYKEYSFNNESLKSKNKVNYLDLRRTLVLDEKGEVKISLPTPVKQKVPSMLEAQIAFSVFDDGRGVSAYKRVDLYAYKHMVGVKLADNSIDKTKALEVDTVLLDPLNQKHKKSVLDVLIKRYRWHYVYDSNGYYRWSKEYEVIENFKVTSGEHFSRKFGNSGNYIIEINDRLGGHSATQNFSVRGWDYNPISPTNDMGKVQVKFEDRPYKKGETLKASITSPILEGRLLVTLEGDKVLWHKLVYIKKGTASIDIPLKYDLKDGLYLHTAIVRATNTPSTLIPFRARSSSFIKPNRELHHTKTVITAPALTHSNRDIKIQVKSDKNSYVVVSVVDEGILQISKQRVPEPFKFFTRQADQKVAYFDLYDKVMHYLTEGKMLNFGGDSASKLKKAQKHKGAKTGAKRVKPFVYWSGLIQTDAEGKAEVTLPIPSFNGQAKIVALTLNKNAIGAASQDLVIRDDIIIKPTYPRFALIGDKLSIPVRIFNTTSKEINASVKVETTEQVSLVGLPETINIPAKSSKIHLANLEAKSFGKGEISITSEALGERYFHNVELPVTYGYPLKTHVFKGDFSGEKNFTIPSEYFNNSTAPKLEISISDNYLSQLKGSVNYLIGYPHGCAEQTSSKMFAMLYIEPFIKGDNSDETKNLLADRKHFINAGISKLANMQRRTGEFSYWNRGGYVNAYASVYASDMMLHLDEYGYSVPDDLISKVYNGLKTMANGRGNYHYGYTSSFERMYAAYLLSEAGRLDLSLVNTIYDSDFYKQNLLTHYMMAAILKKANMTEEMTKILEIIEAYDYSSLSTKRVYGYDFYSYARNLSFALYIHVKNFEKNEISKRLLEATQKAAKHLHSTQEKAMAMRALATYYKDENASLMHVSLDVNGQTQDFNTSFNLSEDLISKNIHVSSKDKLVNYAIDVSQYLPRELRHEKYLKEDKELNIQRSYVNEKGEEISLDDLVQGDLIYSKVQIQSKDRLDNIVINERIPSCFEIINERVHQHKRTSQVQNSASFKVDYQDIRDDRVLSFLSLPTPPYTWKQGFSGSYREYEKNTMTYFTPLRVTTVGECILPAILTEAMYDSRITDYDLQRQSLKVMKTRKKSKTKVDNGLKQKW